VTGTELSGGFRPASTDTLVWQRSGRVRCAAEPCVTVTLSLFKSRRQNVGNLADSE